MPQDLNDQTSLQPSLPEQAPKKRNIFPKVKEARDYLREKAKSIVELQEKLIMEAAAKGQLEAALKANQWLIEHLPAGDDGERVIDESAAKPKEIIQGPTGPSIQIGIALGGMKPTQKLLTSVIDVTPLEDTLDSNSPPHKS